MTMRRPRRRTLEPVAPGEAVGVGPGADLAALYRERHAAMVRLAHLLTGSNAVAEDLVHDVFVSLHTAIERADDPRAYLRTAVVNRCRSHLRRSQLEDRHRRVEPRVELPPDVDETWAALEKIPERRRVALVLRFYEDLSVAEIAEVMDCRTGTVTSLIHRGLASMREVLS
jgi:RNA polymerase sigma factor (sigma-70 family)